MIRLTGIPVVMSGLGFLAAGRAARFYIGQRRADQSWSAAQFPNTGL